VTQPLDQTPKVCPLDDDQIVDVILLFVDEYNKCAKIQLYSYQRIFMRRVIETVLLHTGETLTGLWSRQSGKSEAIASLIGALCIIVPTLAKSFPDDPRLMQYFNGIRIAVFAPKQEQAGYIYDRVRERANSEASKQIYADPDINITVRQSRGDRVSWSNGSYIVAKTASEQSSAEGGTYDLIILDEAQLLSRHKISKEISPMTAATNGSLVMIGTANVSDGAFRDAILYNTVQEKKGARRNHFQFPYDLVIEEKRRRFEETGNPFHLNYEKWVAGELAKLGGNKDNPAFRMNFRLIWEEVNFGAIDLEAFYDSADEGFEFQEFCFSKRLCAGLDYGKKKDATILSIVEQIAGSEEVDPRAMTKPGDDPIIRFKKRIIRVFEIPGRKWADILGKVVDILSNYSVDTLVCDATGVGDPLTETLVELLPDVRVVPYVMSNVGNDKIYKHYLQETSAHRVLYAAGPKTQKTLEYIEFKFEHERLKQERMGVFTKCFAPEGEHDDYCDSAALGVYATTFPKYESPEQLANPFYETRGGSKRGSSRSDRYR